MNKQAKVFIVIVTYKGHRWYDRCFSSLRKSDYPVQTIVVDNASNDGSVEYIREHFPEIHLIESKENLGFGRANNLAMRYALDKGCDYVFLLNQDAWIESNTISELVRIHLDYPEYGVISPMHLTADRQYIAAQIEDGMTNHANLLLSDIYLGSLKEVYQFKYINAAAWLISRNTLETIGGFDPIFFLYGEDDNYLQRMEYHNVKLGLAPLTQIIHDHQDNINNQTDEYKEYRMLQSKLVKYTNILRPISIERMLLGLYKKIFKCILMVKWYKFNEYRNEISFIRRYKKRILLSRKVNKQKGMSWL